MECVLTHILYIYLCIMLSRSTTCNSREGPCFRYMVSHHGHKCFTLDHLFTRKAISLRVKSVEYYSFPICQSLVHTHSNYSTFKLFNFFLIYFTRKVKLLEFLTNIAVVYA